MDQCISRIATKVSVVKPFVFRTEFADGKVTEYDVRKLFDTFPIFKQLEDQELFSKIHLDPLGLGIIWNDEIDLSSDEPYFEGVVVDHIDPNYPLLVGANINLRRLSLEYSQRYLAKKSGVIQADICRIETGKANPTLSTLVKIAKALDLDVQDLFHWQSIN